MISSLPQPKHDTLEKDAAIKAIKTAGLPSSGLGVAQNEPLGIAQNANVVVDSAEYVAETCYDTRKADKCIALSLACILRRASSSVRASTRWFSVSTQACNCTSLGLVMLFATRNCSAVENTIGCGNNPTKLFSSTLNLEEIGHVSFLSCSSTVMSIWTRKIKNRKQTPHARAYLDESDQYTKL